MINDRNRLFPLPLLWARDTTLPLEAIGGRGGTRDEPGVEAPTARAELEGNVAKVESNVSCLPLVLVVCLYGGGGIGFTEISISSSKSVSTRSGTFSSSSSSSCI